MSQSTQAATAADADARTPQQIEADIQRARESLADDIDVLQDRLSPASLLQTAKKQVIGLFQRPDGSLDPVRVAAAAGVGLLLVTYVVRRSRL